MSTLEKIENTVVEGIKNIGEEACDMEKVAENLAVGTYKKIETAVVEGFTKISDAFVEKYLMKEGETLEEAKARIEEEQKELVKKNLEASLNAGKR